MVEIMDRQAYLSDFFEAIKEDARISVTHIGIYAALLEYSLQKGGVNPIVVFSHEVMTIAKVSSPLTYRKCVQDLNEYGYIRYEPSFSRMKGSKVYFVKCLA